MMNAQQGPPFTLVPVAIECRGGPARPPRCLLSYLAVSSSSRCSSFAASSRVARTQRASDCRLTPNSSQTSAPLLCVSRYSCTAAALSSSLNFGGLICTSPLQWCQRYDTGREGVRQYGKQGNLTMEIRDTFLAYGQPADPPHMAFHHLRRFPVSPAAGSIRVMRSTFVCSCTSSACSFSLSFLRSTMWAW